MRYEYNARIQEKFIRLLADALTPRVSAAVASSPSTLRAILVRSDGRLGACEHRGYKLANAMRSCSLRIDPFIATSQRCITGVVLTP